MKHTYLFLLSIIFISISAFAGPDKYPVDPAFLKARASGTKYVVTNTKDSGVGSLRWAIDNLEGASEFGAVISFSKKLNGKTIKLTSGELPISASPQTVEITACDLSRGITIDAQGLSRVLKINPISGPSSTQVRLDSLTITGGQAPDGEVGSFYANGVDGGGILSNAVLMEVVNCTITENRAGNGALRNSGGTGNGGHSGGLHFFGEELRIFGTTISNNEAGDGGDAETDNAGRGGEGGGLGVAASEVTIVESTIQGNRSGSGGANSGGSPGSGGAGGGLHVYGSEVTLQRTTISGNSSGTGGLGLNGQDGKNAGRGGGVFVTTGSILEMENCTIAKNIGGNGGDAELDANSGNGGGQALGGAGISSLGDAMVKLTHCTVYGNQNGTRGIDADGFADEEMPPGHQISNLGTNPIVIRNSIIDALELSDAVEGDLTEEGTNVIEDGLELAPLGNYGGLTETMPPVESTVEDFGEADSDFVLKKDQRGVFRKAPCVDIGAVQFDPLARVRWIVESDNESVFTVTNTKDSGAGSLRQTIADAGSLDESVILFSSKLNGKTIKLTTGELDITSGSNPLIAGAYLPKNSTVPIPLSKRVTVSGNQKSRLFQVNLGATPIFWNLNLKNGVGQGGGAVFADRANLTLMECEISDNVSATTKGVSTSGGAIQGVEILKAIDCRFTNNSIEEGVKSLRGGGGDGGALYSHDKTILIDCVFENNRAANRPSGSNEQAGSGGAIFVDGGQLDAVDCEFEDNLAGSVDAAAASGFGGDGGAIYVENSTDAIAVIGSTFVGNLAGTGSNGGEGGAMWLNAEAEITNSTLFGNAAGDSTTSGNAGRGGGIAIESDGVVTLSHVTVIGNSAGIGMNSQGGGVRNTGDLTLTNSIITKNSADSDINISGSITSENGVNQKSGVPNLAPLGYFGGPTRTMPPFPGSQVVNVNSAAGGTALDQRRAARGSNPPDLGAVELDLRIVTLLNRLETNSTADSPVESTVAFEEEAAGKYSGLINDANGDPIGKIDVTASAPSGAITVTLSGGLAGLKGKIKGELDGAGQFPATFNSEGIDYDLDIQLVDTEDGNFRLVGAITESGGGTTFDISLDHSVFHKKTNPSPYAGRYTASIPANTPNPTEPKGDGYAFGSASTSGSIKLTGVLGDNTKFSMSGLISGDGEWRLFHELYRTAPKGYLGGTVTFRNVPNVSDFDGGLTWVKNADTREKYYPAGFDADSKIIGNRYDRPFKNSAILYEIVAGESSNAEWRIGYGGVKNPGSKKLTWQINNRVTPHVDTADETLKIKASVKTGFVSGTHLDRKTGQKIVFRGVALQKQGVITGVFPGVDDTGFFVIKAAGEPVFTLVGVSENDTAIIGPLALNEPDGKLHIAQRNFEVRNDGDANLWIPENPIFEENVAPGLPGHFRIIGGGPVLLSPGESAIFGVGYSEFGIPIPIGATDIPVQFVSNDSKTSPFNFLVSTSTSSGPGQFIDQTNWEGTTPGNLFPDLIRKTVSAFDPAIHGGTFTGTARDLNGAAEAEFAKLSVNTKTGAFSATYFVGGAKKVLKGILGVDGQAQSELGDEIDYSLRLITDEDETGSFFIVGQIDGINLQTGKNPFHKKTNPATEFEGRFTMAFPSSERRGEEKPRGDGYGTTSIGLDGVMKSTIVLGDGTKTSHAGFVSGAGEIQFHKALYRTKPKGHLSGAVRFEDIAGVSDFHGQLRWKKFADIREKRFSRGFEINQVAIGNRFEVPSTPAITFTPNDSADLSDQVFVEFSESDLPNLPAPIEVEWTSANKIIHTRINREKLSLKMNLKTGLISGSYTDPDQKQKIKVGAAVLQKQKIAVGNFIGKLKTGVIVFAPLYD